MSAANHRCAIRRRAISLIELVVVIAVGSVLLTLTIVAFSRFLGMSRFSQVHLERHMGLVRLAAQFRSDVWSAADAAEPADQPGMLRLTTAAGERIEYRFDEPLVRRNVLQGEAVQSREAFKLPGVAGARWEIDAAQPRPRVTLRLDLAPAATATTREHGEKSMQVSAALARDLRFVAVQEARP